MIAASAVLVVVAFITLVVGIFQTGLGLIWMSIAASVLAAIFLLLGVVRGRPPKVAVPTGPEPGTWGEGATGYQEPAATGWEPGATITPEEPTVEVEEAMPEPEPPVPTPRRAPARPATRPAAGRSAATRTAGARATGAARAARPSAAAGKQVVVIPDRDKFHMPTCRYAKGAGAMKMTKPEARRDGYKPCGVCKP